MIHWQN